MGFHNSKITRWFLCLVPITVVSTQTSVYPESPGPLGTSGPPGSTGEKGEQGPPGLVSIKITNTLKRVQTIFLVLVS